MSREHLRPKTSEEKKAKKAFEARLRRQDKASSMPQTSAPYKSTPLGEYARKHALRITFKKVPSRPDSKGWGAGSHHYHFTVARTDMKVPSFSGYYSMGSAHKSGPDADDLLNSLYLDASSAEGSFEDYCSNFGCDSDSREQEKIYKACLKTRKNLERMLLPIEGLAMAVQEQGL